MVWHNILHPTSAGCYKTCEGSLNRLSTLIATGALALAAAAGLWFGRPSAATVPVEPVVYHEAAIQTLTVYVSGAVLRPGLIELTAPARVADAIAGAGGALAHAVLDGVNLAAPVSDGQHIEVPSRQAPRSPSATEDGKVAINRAGAQELESLPGVGPVLAQRIFDYREQNGPFETVEDLLDVPGIGEGKLAALRDAVIVP